MLLLVGLGNPGKKYEGTRHNIGFAVLDFLAGRHGFTLNQTRFSSRVGRGRIKGTDVLFARPQTFMNLSGQAVRQIIEYLDLSLDDLLVLHDDLDVELGRIKVAARGGSGGHKGVASIIESLGQDEFARIKVGVGRPAKANDLVTTNYRILMDDGREILSEDGYQFIIGTGAHGAMRVAKAVEGWLKGLGVRWEAHRTGEACERYNDLVGEGKRVVAAFHLTC